jgi:hypothetical protein
MNLLYITFGKEPSIYLQASFSIYSFLAQAQPVHSINIITDKEDYYRHLAPHVNIILMTETELAAWKGEYRFFWRIKIKALEKLCHLYPGAPVMYVDCDTFLYGDIAVLQDSLQKGVALMHENEGFLSERKNKTQKNMWRQIANKTFGNIIMQPTHNMWNAGLVATPNTHNGKDCELALTICDEMCKQGITKYFIEQYSLSLAFEKYYALAEAKSVIVHYWSAKEIWNKYIGDFFMRAYFGQWDYEKIIEELRFFDTTQLPAFQKVKNTNLRLKKIVDKIFPNRNHEYLPPKK